MERTGKMGTLGSLGRVERETLLETDIERAWEAILSVSSSLVAA